MNLDDFERAQDLKARLDALKRFLSLIQEESELGLIKLAIDIGSFPQPTCKVESDVLMLFINQQITHVSEKLNDLGIEI